MAFDFSKGLLGAPAPNSYAQTGQQIGNLIGSLFGFKVPEFEARRIMGEVDYNDPTSLQTAAQQLMRMGKIEEGLSLAGQARAITKEERAYDLQKQQFELTKGQAARAEEKAKWDAYERNPQLAIEQAGKETDEAKIRELLMFAANKLTDKEYARATERARIKASEAQAAQAQATANKAVESDWVTEEGKPLVIKNDGKYYTSDGKQYTGKAKLLSRPTGIAGQLGAFGFGGGDATNYVPPNGFPTYDQQTKTLK